VRLALLSGGAAQALVGAIAREAGWEVAGAFGPVGAMKERLLAGEAADLVILTAALIEELAAAGQLVAATRADLGRVRTGLAVRAGDPVPPIATPAELRAALAAAGEIHLADPQKATAGIHFMRVLEALGIAAPLAARLRPHPGGVAAMHALAKAADARALGCTQITEILAVPGVALAGPLPREFELATVYSGAVTTRAADPAAARSFLGLLAGESSRRLRERLGFEPA